MSSRTGESVSLLRLTKSIAAADEAFGRRYGDEEMKERVNRLNSLYVAFTRACSELHVIGVKRERESFPFAIFPEGMAYCRGDAIDVPARPEETSASTDAFHHSMPFESGSEPDDAIRFEEKKRGELVHRLFSSIEYLEGATEERIAEALSRMRMNSGIDDTALDALGALAIAFLRIPLVSGYYERMSGRRVFMEQEIADAEGRLFRVDRIVVDPDKVTIIEYKTGSDRQGEGKHLAQMRNYLRIAADLYPDRPVEGIIGYVDAKRTRSVSGKG